MNLSFELIVSILGACFTCIGFIIQALRKLNGILKKIDNIDDGVKHTQQDILRLALHSESLPIEERLNAGQKYVQSGGNGASKIFYQELCKKYKKRLRK